MAKRLTPRFSQAVEYARILTGTETRKGTKIPYLTHLLAVSALVLEHGGDETQAIAALLHDAAEDHGGYARLRAIQVEFGAPVALIVEHCSDSLKPEGEPKDPWWTRKVDYLAGVEDETPRIALVAAADKVHNLESVVADYRTLGEKLWPRFNEDAGRAGSLWYYRRVAELLPPRLARAAAPLGQRLRRRVTELRALVAERVDADALEKEYAACLMREREVRAARL